MEIRLLKKRDIPAAVAVVGRNYKREYQHRAKRELLDMFDSGPIRPRYFVAAEKRQIVGFAGFSQSWMDYDIYEIFWVNVDPARQNKGIGKKLVARAIREIYKEKNARLILLSAGIRSQLPTYYRKHFKFKTLQSFNGHSYCLMSRPVGKK